jgi:hypothetical protein
MRRKVRLFLRGSGSIKKKKNRDLAKREEKECVSTVANKNKINKFSILASVDPGKLDYRLN